MLISLASLVVLQIIRISLTGDIFFKSLNEIMNVYMKENSISIIIDKKNIVMAAVKNDISNEIIDLVNK